MGMMYFCFGGNLNDICGPASLVEFAQVHSPRKSYKSFYVSLVYRLKSTYVGLPVMQCAALSTKPGEYILGYFLRDILPFALTYGL